MYLRKRDKNRKDIGRKLIIKMENKWKRFINGIKLYLHEIMYFVLLVILTRYILLHWEECIAMQFFEKFDGNNILFLIWLALLILPFYDVEAKGWKLRRKIIKDTEKQYENAESDFIQNQIDGLRENMQSQNLEEINGGNHHE